MLILHTKWASVNSERGESALISHYCRDLLYVMQEQQLDCVLTVVRIVQVDNLIPLIVSNRVDYGLMIVGSHANGEVQKSGRWRQYLFHGRERKQQVSGSCTTNIGYFNNCWIQFPFGEDAARHRPRRAEGSGQYEATKLQLSNATYYQ